MPHHRFSSKCSSKCSKQDECEQPVFTLSQMKRVVDLIDRQQMQIDKQQMQIDRQQMQIDKQMQIDNQQMQIVSNYTSQDQCPVTIITLTFAENKASSLTTFSYTIPNGTYTALLDATPAAINLFNTEGIVEYTNGLLYLLSNNGSAPYPINLQKYSIKAKYIDGTIPKIEFRDIPASVMKTVLSNGFVTVTNPNTYTSIGTVKYERYL